jgi:hypothetical protein
MNSKPTAIERAFQLAKSGRYASVANLRKTLEAEGYPKEHFSGPTMRKQLEGLIRSAQGSQNARGAKGEKRPKQPTDEKMTERAIGRWNNEGGAPAPAKRPKAAQGPPKNKAAAPKPGRSPTKKRAAEITDALPTAR